MQKKLFYEMHTKHLFKAEPFCEMQNNKLMKLK